MLKRGFKSWAEQASVSYRKELGLDKTAPLAAFIVTTEALEKFGSKI